MDGNGNLFLAVLNEDVVLEWNHSSGTVSIVAGSLDNSTFSGDGGPATAAGLGGPIAVAVDSNDNLYIADYYDGRIRRVDHASGTISTVAGGGSSSYPSSNGGAATAALLTYPDGVAVDGNGNLYISDNTFLKWGVREVNATTQIITTVAGGGPNEQWGDGGPATQAFLYQPAGLALDAAGDLWVGSSYLSVGGAFETLGNVRMISAATGIISTVAGNGQGNFGGDGGPATAALLNYPADIAVDASGAVYIADESNFRVREVLPDGDMTTIAGDGGNGNFDNYSLGEAATSVALGHVTDVAVDAGGDVFLSLPEYSYVLEVSAATGRLSVLAGDGSEGDSGDGGPATAASLASPVGLAVAGSDLYIAEQVGDRIRCVNLVTGIISTVAGDGTAGFSGDGGLATAAELQGSVLCGRRFLGNAVHQRRRQCTGAGREPADGDHHDRGRRRQLRLFRQRRRRPGHGGGPLASGDCRGRPAGPLHQFVGLHPRGQSGERPDQHRGWRWRVFHQRRQQRRRRSGLAGQSGRRGLGDRCPRKPLRRRRLQ